MAAEHDDTAGLLGQLHAAAHAGRQLAGNHPVREVAGDADLKRAKERDVEMPAANDGKGHGGFGNLIGLYEIPTCQFKLNPLILN